jgi:hypothetical protein
MGHVPLTSFAYDVQGLLAVTSRLGLLRSGAQTRLCRRLDALTEAHNRLWVLVLEEALALVRDGGGEADAAPLLERTRERAAGLVLEIDEVRRAIERACESPPRCDIGFPRTAAAVAIAATVLAGGCWHVGPDEELGGIDDGFVEESDGGGAEAPDAGDPDGGTTDEPLDGYTTCDEGIAADQHQEIVDQALDNYCGHPCYYTVPEGISYRFLLDEEGHVIGMEREDGEPIPDELVECYLEAVGDQTFLCLTIFPYWENCEPLALE